MRVAFSLLTLFPGRVGGSETYVRGLLGEYQRNPQADEITVLVNRHVASAYGATGIAMRELRSYRSGDSRLTRFLAMNAGRVWPTLSDEFDAIHYPVTVPIPRARATPSIVTLLDVQHHELPEMFSPAERWFRGWAYDDSARRASSVVTISEHAKRGIVDRLNVDPDRVRVIYLGIDHARFTADGEGPADMPERYVIYPANFWPHKNHARLLEAFERVRDESLHLVLTGQTYGRESIAADRPRIRVLGHVSDETLARLYRGAAAMVFPSLFEGFGLPVPEAMACGTPVCCSDRGAVAEVAGGAAELFNPEDSDAIAAAIDRLCSDELRRHALREAGLARAAQFTWYQTATAHTELYQAVTSAPVLA